jgi:Fe-S-cluster containining protein
MATAPMSQKEAIWLACKAKTCCYVATVIPTGRDVWRIARALEIPPWSFVRYFESPTPKRDAFILDGSGRRFRLVLAKQPSKKRKTPPPCTFLMRTNDGHHRCSLGDLRPRSCQAFPSDLAHGVVCLNPAGCRCRSWNLADVDIEEERMLVEVRLRENDEYVDTVVSRWNTVVEDAGPDARFDFVQFCEFLLRTYDECATAVSRDDR